ncbi:MAG: hypothetical protein R3B59_07355 [Dehalococcoidia bacterium]
MTLDPELQAKHPLPPELVKRGAEMMDRQCSLWGADVKHEGGNLLVRHGFERHPPANGVGSSCYILPHADATVVLRGYGCFYRTAAHGEVFIPRFDFVPRYTSCPGEPIEAIVPAYADRHGRPSTLEWAAAGQLFLRALHWIGHYERWVCAELGPEVVREPSLPRDPAARSPLAWAHAWGALTADCEVALGAFAPAGA